MLKKKLEIRIKGLVCARPYGAPRRHRTANRPLPTSPILDMHIMLVKLNNRTGIEVKIQVKTYLIYPAELARSPAPNGHAPLATFENDR